MISLARLGAPLLLVTLTISTPLTQAMAGDPDLDSAVAKRDASAIAGQFSKIASANPKLAAKLIPAAYSTIEKLPETDIYPGDRYRIFAAASNTLGRIENPAAVKILEKSCRSSKDWRVRFIVLHAAMQHAKLDAVGLSLRALKAKDARLVALAARILGRSQDVQALDPLLVAMAKWESRKLQEKIIVGRKAIEVDLGGRAWLACRDALYRLTGKGFHVAQDFKNYVRVHRAKIDPKKVKLGGEEKTKQATRVGLFGLDITGRNIMFILDISGSMNTSDPFTPEQIAELRKPGRTRVRDKEDPLVAEFMQDRKRIKRAKRELISVVRSLPEDKNFNVILYSNDVTPWQDFLVPATQAKKNAFVTHGESIKAYGVTFTDDAMRRALDDPSVDTIYLITDGAPTHLGSQGKAMPPDADMLMKQILEETKRRNYLRRVRIFTLGFEGAEEEFLKKLADQNEGTYTRID